MIVANSCTQTNVGWSQKFRNTLLCASIYIQPSPQETLHLSDYARALLQSSKIHCNYMHNANTKLWQTCKS